MSLDLLLSHLWCLRMVLCRPLWEKGMSVQQERTQCLMARRMVSLLANPFITVWISGNISIRKRPKSHWRQGPFSLCPSPCYTQALVYELFCTKKCNNHLAHYINTTLPSKSVIPVSVKIVVRCTRLYGRYFFSATIPRHFPFYILFPVYIKHLLLLLCIQTTTCCGNGGELRNKF